MSSAQGFTLWNFWLFHSDCCQRISWLCPFLQLSSGRSRPPSSRDCWQNSVACGCRTDVPRFLAGCQQRQLSAPSGCPELLAAFLLPDPFPAWQLTSSRPVGESLYSWLRWNLILHTWGDPPFTVAVFCWQGADHRFYFSQGLWTIQEFDTGIGDHGTILEFGTLHQTLLFYCCEIPRVGMPAMLEIQRLTWKSRGL